MYPDWHLHFQTIPVIVRDADFLFSTRKVFWFTSTLFSHPIRKREDKMCHKWLERFLVLNYANSSFLIVFHSNKSKKRSSYHYTMTASWTVVWCKRKVTCLKVFIIEITTKRKRASITTTLTLRKENRNDKEPRETQPWTKLQINNWERHWVIKEFLKRSVNTFGNIKLWSPYASILAVFAVEEDHIERAQDLTR